MSSANGRLEGAYREGNRDGKWVGHYPDGSKSGEAEFQADVLDGPFRALYANGKTLAEGVFKNGKLSGPMVLFDRMGRRRLVIAVGPDGSSTAQTGFDEAGKEVAPGTEFTRQNIGRSDFFDFILRTADIAPLY
jgi:antitoxin component YwqK of YwqJK toxin-antitoxin module